MKLISEDCKQRIIDQTDIVDIIGQHTQLKRQGAKYIGLCPFHTEKSPSFQVDPEKKFYYCFGCERGGDVVKFVREVNKFSFTEAMEYLADRAHVPMEYVDSYGKTSSTNDGYDKKKRLYEMNKEAAKFFFNCFKRSEKAQKYIASRGLSKDTIIKYAIGYAPADGNILYRYLSQKGYRDDEMLEVGLVKRREDSNRIYDAFRDRVMFPILDKQSRVIAFGGRVFDDSKPKYLNSPESTIFYKKNNLFNLNNARKVVNETTPLIVTEGYMDVISLANNGIVNAVASLGTAFGEDHVKLIRLENCPVVLNYDGDAPGVKAAVRASEFFEAASMAVKVLFLPDNEDPDSFIRKYGKDKFLELVDKAPYSIEFKIDVIAKRFDLEDIAQKGMFIKQACGFVCKDPSEVTWDLYARKISQMTRTDIAMVKKQILLAFNGETKADEEQLNEIPKKKTMTNTEICLLKYVMQSFVNFSDFLNLCDMRDYFVTNDSKSVFKDVVNAYKDDHTVDIFKNLRYNNKLDSIVAMIASYPNDVGRQELGNYVMLLKRDFYQARINELEKKIRSSGGDDDVMGMLKELSDLKKTQMNILNGGESVE